MKKKILGVLVSGVAVFALNGCGGGSDGGGSGGGDVPPVPTAVLVDNLTLDLGTRIEIYNYSDTHTYDIDICPSGRYHIDDISTNVIDWDHGYFINNNPMIALHSDDITLPLLSIYSSPESPGELREGYDYDLAVADGWHGWNRIRVQYIGTPVCP